MKKFASVALSAAMLLTLFAGCGARETAPETTVAPETTAAPETTIAPETTVMPEEGNDVPTEGAELTELQVLADTIYENHAEIDLPMMTNVLDLSDADLLAYNTGLDSADGITEIVISEPMMGQPFSLILMRAEDAANAADLAQKLYDSVDQRKWVCMEADTKTAAYYDDVIMFFMVSSDFSDVATTDTMMEAFRAAAGTDITEIG